MKYIENDFSNKLEGDTETTQDEDGVKAKFIHLHSSCKFLLPLQPANLSLQMHHRHHLQLVPANSESMKPERKMCETL